MIRVPARFAPFFFVERLAVFFFVAFLATFLAPFFAPFFAPFLAAFLPTFFLRVAIG